MKRTLTDMEAQALKTLTLSNYKRFPSLRLAFTSRSVIVGSNGSGKTQILWAVLIFLRAVNLRKSTNNSSSTEFTLSDTLYELIASPYFSAPASFESFVTVGAADKLAKISGTLAPDSSNFELTLKANGNLLLQNLPPLDLAEKIRFAYMTSAFMFTSPKIEVRGLQEIWTSSQQNLRGLYMSLDQRFKDCIESYVKMLFKIKSIRNGLDDKNYWIFIKEQNDTEMEVSLQGCALQRVLATWILFFTLASHTVKEKRRLFLLEEPENFLYPNLVQQFFSQLYNEAQSCNIQLLVTSNSPEVIASFPQASRIVLSGTSPQLLSIDLHEQELYSLASLKTDLPILLLDGRNDITFITSLLPEIATKFQLISVASEAVAQSIIAKNKKLLILWLRDLEFYPEEDIQARADIEKKEYGIPVYFWKLPCIESFLLLDRLLRGMDHNLLIPYFRALDSAVSFQNGFSQKTTRKFPTNIKASNIWDQGIAEVIKQDTPPTAPTSTSLSSSSSLSSSPTSTSSTTPTPASTRNWYKIVRLIHGHTWVDKFIKSTTTELIAESRFHMHSEVKDMLAKTATSLLGHLQN